MIDKASAFLSVGVVGVFFDNVSNNAFIKPCFS